MAFFTKIRALCLAAVLLLCAFARVHAEAIPVLPSKIEYTYELFEGRSMTLSILMNGGIVSSVKYAIDDYKATIDLERKDLDSARLGIGIMYSAISYWEQEKGCLGVELVIEYNSESTEEAGLLIMIDNCGRQTIDLVSNFWDIPLNDNISR